MSCLYNVQNDIRPMAFERAAHSVCLDSVPSAQMKAASEGPDGSFLEEEYML